MSPKKTLILAHLDADGVCSAAIAKTAYPDAKVEFAVAGDLPSKLHGLSGYDRLIILDLRPNKEQMEEVKQLLSKISKTCKIIYIDHHPFPKGMTRKDLAACDTIVHGTNASTSELALKFFKPPPSLEFIAALGAIGDYQDRTPLMEKLLERLGTRKCYPEALYLDRALKVVDDSFRRRMTEELASGKWPQETSVAKEYAKKVVRQRKMVEKHIREKYRRVCSYVLFVGDVPLEATSLAAELLVELLGAEVGIASCRMDDHLRLSARRRWESDIRLDELMSECASAVGGFGGGHIGASGGKIPAEKLEDFLNLVRWRLCK
jgi:single-stranded-DNA-specific exonuclease